MKKQDKFKGGIQDMASLKIVAGKYNKGEDNPFTIYLSLPLLQVFLHGRYTASGDE